jgi:hypothetical protein
VRLASLEHPISPIKFGWDDRLGDLEGERQSLVERLDNSGGHLRGGMPVAGADAAATLPLPVAAALVTHQLIDDPGGDALVLQPGREAVPKIVGSAKSQMRQVGSGAVGCVLVEAAKVVARQGRPCTSRHPVPAAWTGKDKSVTVRSGRQPAANRLDHQRSQWNLADASVALGRGLKPLPNWPAW